MAATLTAAGLPGWASGVWSALAVIVPASSWLCLLAAMAALGRRARGRELDEGRSAAVLAAAGVVGAVVFFIAGRTGSSAPEGGRFCFAPPSWTGEAAPTCADAWPIVLLVATLCGCAVVGLAAVAIESSARGRWIHALAWGAVAIAIGGAARMLSADGFVNPDPFRAGGIVPLATAVAQSMFDGVTIGVALLGALAQMAWRALTR